MQKQLWYFVAFGVLVVAPLSIWAQTAGRPQRAAVVKFQPSPGEPRDPLAEPTPPPPEPRRPDTERVPPRDPSTRPAPRDPTTVDPALRPLLDPPTAAARPALPAIQLRGRIVMPNGKAVGMISIDKQYFTIEKGSRIDAGGVLLEVTSITATDVSVRIDELDRVIQLR